MVTAATAVAWFMFGEAHLTDVVMVYLLGVALVSMRFGYGPSLFAAVLSVVAFEFFFIPPLFSFAVSDLRHVVTFAVMFLVAFVISHQTQLIRNQADVARRAELLVQTEKIRNALLSSVSHDFRTPLAVVMGATGALLERPPRDEDKRRALLKTAHDEAVRLNRFLRNLLDMTRLQGGALTVRRELQPLEVVVGAALHRLEDRVADHEVTTIFPGDLPLVAFDSLLIEQVLVNLLENAAKHTPLGRRHRRGGQGRAGRGGGRGRRPRARRRACGHRARLRQVLPRQRARGRVRGARPDDLPGRRRGPRRPDLGRGSAGRRRLVPLYLASVRTGRPRCRDSATQREVVVSQKQPLVLVVEDEGQMRTFVSIALEAYRLLDARRPRRRGTGSRQAAAHVPDLVLLDLGLPDGDGGEVTRRIREWSSLPILVISARDAEASKVKALDEGADDYITKPFGAAELMARVRVALRKAGPRDAPADVVQVGNEIRVDMRSRVVIVRDEEVHLAPVEYKLLVALVRRAGRVVVYKELIDQVWGSDQGQQVQTLRVYMAQLRRKLEKQPARPKYLLTETGVGYRLRLAI